MLGTPNPSRGMWASQDLHGKTRFIVALFVVLIVRPAWLTDRDEVDYETTEKGEAFKGTEVSRKSVAAYVLGIL